jgi:hypothetical protein
MREVNGRDKLGSRRRALLRHTIQYLNTPNVGVRKHGGVATTRRSEL